jgi:hypothetical protein
MGKWGGMPVGAFTASTAMMDLLSDNPKLGISPLLGTPCHCVSLFSYTAEITETDLMPRTLIILNHFLVPLQS